MTDDASRPVLPESADHQEESTQGPAESPTRSADPTDAPDETLFDDVVETIDASVRDDADDEAREQAVPTSVTDADAALAIHDTPPDDQLVAIVEAVVFASPDPITLKALAKLLDPEPVARIEAAIAVLRSRYDAQRGLQVVEIANGYQIVTRPELHEWVRRLFHERTTQKLSVAALETLAVIAYKQPVTAAEIAEIRSVNTSGVLGTLVDRHLIKIAGRKAVVGRPFMYATTREFLERFGLRDLNDLPRVEDMADVLGFDPPLLEDHAVETALPFDADIAESDPAAADSSTDLAEGSREAGVLTTGEDGAPAEVEADADEDAEGATEHDA